MKHPNQATLALHAGGDLGFFARWKTERHLAHCDLCRDEMAAFDQIREMLPDLAEIPEVQWNRLAAEMKANVRLGLAAGECVRTNDSPLRERRLFTGARAAVAVASIMTLVATGILLQNTTPALADDRTVVQTTLDGIQVGAGDQAFCAGDHEKARRIQRALLPLVGVAVTHGIAGLKLAMSLAGLRGGSVRAPLLPAAPGLAEEIRPLLAAVDAAL